MPVKTPSAFMTGKAHFSSCHRLLALYRILVPDIPYESPFLLTFIVVSVLHLV